MQAPVPAQIPSDAPPEIPFGTVPFSSAEEAWFWFIDAHEARHAGAKIVAGMALFPRPCEPVDIMKIVDRLYRQRRLQADHIRVLIHYGQRRCPPDHRRPAEQKSVTIWHDALEIIEGMLRLKGIVA